MSDMNGSYTPVEDALVMRAIRESLTLLITGVNGEILEANARCCELLGYKESEILGRHCSSILIDANLKQNYKCLLGNTLVVDKKKGYVQAVKKNADLLWLDVTCIPVDDGNGSIVHTLSILKDGTVVMAQHRQLENFMRAKSQVDKPEG